MDLSTLEGLIPLGVAVFSVLSAWYAMKLAAAKNADAIQALHDRVENLAKQIKGLWSAKDKAVEAEIGATFLRRDVDELREEQKYQRRKSDA